ncbi:MAG: phytanoyl-CoA dioxygenase family protein [Pseudomonadales bacterium]
MKSHYPLTVPDNLIQNFATNGYVVTPNVLTSQEIDRYGLAVDLAVDRRRAGDHRELSEKTRYEQSFLQCMRLWETEPDVCGLSLHPGLAGIAAQLLGVKKVILWQDQALYKEAGGAETTPHQDQPFWPISDSPMVSAWIPFDAIHAGNGAMAYVPGSHKAGRLKVVDITHSTAPYDILNDPALGDSELETIAINPGSVVWHHGMTVHAASENASEQTRRAFTVVFLDGDARRTKAWPSFPLDRAEISVGDRVAGVGLPQVWPPLSKRPKPPSNIGRALGPQ